MTNSFARSLAHSLKSHFRTTHNANYNGYYEMVHLWFISESTDESTLRNHSDYQYERRELDNRTVVQTSSEDQSDRFRSSSQHVTYDDR